MSEPARWNGQMPPSSQRQGQMPAASNDGTNLADILERVLDKGIVIAGDIQINLLDIELLTIKLRLVVASVDKAKEMGIDWWERDPTLSSGHRELEDENERLRKRIEALEGSTPRKLAGKRAKAAEDADEGEDADLEDADLEDAGEADLTDDVDDEAVDEREPEPAPARPRRTSRTSTGTTRGSGGSTRSTRGKRS